MRISVWKRFVAVVSVSTLTATLLPSCWRTQALPLDQAGDGDSTTGGDTDGDVDSDSDGDSDTGGDSDADSDTDVDTDVDVDTDTESASETESVMDCEGDSVWYDETFGLCWQAVPGDLYVDWSEAVDYCDELILDDHDDWILPDIDQLRSLIQGCPATEPGGDCPVTVDSPHTDETEACSGCWPPGPGPGGCFFDPDLEGTCARIWSSSVVNPYLISAWTVAFTHGNVESTGKNQGSTRARCVRMGE